MLPAAGCVLLHHVGCQKVLQSVLRGCLQVRQTDSPFVGKRAGCRSQPSAIKLDGVLHNQQSALSYFLQKSLVRQYFSLAHQSAPVSLDLDSTADIAESGPTTGCCSLRYFSMSSKKSVTCLQLDLSVRQEKPLQKWYSYDLIYCKTPCTNCDHTGSLIWTRGHSSSHPAQAALSPTVTSSHQDPSQTYSQAQKDSNHPSKHRVLHLRCSTQWM